MHLLAEAWRLRREARTAITAREFRRGVKLAMQAQEIQRTASGEALLTIGAWLAR
jgi:hypothetical protein